MSVANRIPISVRISQEDADFIANLQVEGANTPSEKIRELLKQARQSYTQPQDYGTALARCVTRGKRAGGSFAHSGALI